MSAYGLGDDALRRMTATDVEILLPDDFLTKVDRASMACGLEVRPPLVDHEFLELTARIPSRWKVRSNETKWIFKKLCEHRLPSDVVWRRKQGFEIPVDDWLRGPLRDAFGDLVLAPSAPIAEFIDVPTANELYRAHVKRSGRHGTVLWSLLVLGAWTQRYLGNSARNKHETCLENRHDFASRNDLRRYRSRPRNFAGARRTLHCDRASGPLVQECLYARRRCAGLFLLHGRCFVLTILDHSLGVLCDLHRGLQQLCDQ